MKFQNWMHRRLMNEAGEADGGGGDVGGDSSDVGEYSNDNESIQLGASDAFKDLGLDPNTYGIGDSKTVGTEEEKAQGSEEIGAAGQATDEKSILDQINSLGLVHNEAPVKVENIDQVKELIQKGHDYTLKTQALSEERKVWDSEKKAAEDELNGAINAFNEQYKGLETQLQEMQQFRFALDHLKEAAPDVFQEVQAAYSDIGKRFKNPILDQQMEAMNKRLAEAESQLKTRENALVIDKFESEKSALSATEQSFKELGVTIDWNQVKKEWASTGLPVKQVIGSLYIDHVAKAQASKTKVDATRAKVQARPTGAGGASRPGGQKVQQLDPKLSHFAAARELLKRYST